MLLFIIKALSLLTTIGTLAVLYRAYSQPGRLPNHSTEALATIIIACLIPAAAGIAYAALTHKWPAIWILLGITGSFGVGNALGYHLAGWRQGDRFEVAMGFGFILASLNGWLLSMALLP